MAKYRLEVVFESQCQMPLIGETEDRDIAITSYYFIYGECPIEKIALYEDGRLMSWEEIIK